jgi:antitoxin component of MazEF toxin-antitoxin module
MNEYEKYEGKIIVVGNSIGFTIPDKVAKFGGYKVGDNVKIMIRKKS